MFSRRTCPPCKWLQCAAKHGEQVRRLKRIAKTNCDVENEMSLDMQTSLWYKLYTSVLSFVQSIQSEVSYERPTDSQSH